VADDESPNAPPIKQIYVGFRYYNEEEGHKTCEERVGKKYVGWSSRYDEWIPVTSSRVQRLRAVSRFYKVAGKAQMQYELGNIIDENDVIFNTDTFSQWAVHREFSVFSKLKFFPDFINEFGTRGGFKKILKLFNGELKDTPLTIRHIFFITEFLAKINPLLARQFMVYFTPRFKNAFLKAIMSGPLKSSFNKDHLSGAQGNFTKLLKRYYPWHPSGSSVRTLDDNYHLIEADMIFSVAITLLKSEKLEQRVSGLN